MDSKNVALTSKSGVHVPRYKLFSHPFNKVYTKYSQISNYYYSLYQIVNLCMQQHYIALIVVNIAVVGQLTTVVTRFIIS